MSKPSKIAGSVSGVKAPRKPSKPAKGPAPDSPRLAALKRLGEKLADDSIPLDQIFTIRYLRLDLGPDTFDADMVRSVRESIGASQSAFALLLGVSPDTVRSWEQGRRSPSGMAARFLDEIRRNPDYFRARLAEAIVRS